MIVEIRGNGGTVTVTSPRYTVQARSPAYKVDVKSAVVMGGGIPYTGEYTVTPSEDEQVLQTRGKALSQNVTVAPIPSNYGRIAYDGTQIMVW